MFKIKPILLALSLVLVSARLHAQIEEKPLAVRSVSTSHMVQQGQKSFKKANSDTLILPFFEDFLYGPGYPDTNKWQDNYVYVNNDFGILPPSYGVATFDQLDAKGNPWFPFTQFSAGPADSLTSKPINLKDSGGVSYQIKDSIYFSFFYQSKGLGDLSKNADSFYLQFKNEFGAWTTVWRAAGGGMNAFKQVVIALTDPTYLHASFQFRFASFTHQWGNNNHFHLDYIYLNKNRRMSQLGYDDYAVSTPPTSLLKVYSNMPYTHFLASPSAYTADSIFFNVSNLSKDVLNIEVKHKETSGGNTLIETNSVNNAANVPAFGNSLRRFAGFPLTGLTGNKVVIERTYELREPSVLNAYRDNDKIVLNHTFDNYYAYDDGSAEAGFGFNDLLKGDGAIAVKYVLAKADTLRAIQVFYNQSVKDVSRVSFTLNIWNKLTEAPVIQFVNTYPTYTGVINGFYQYILDSAILLPAGEVYIGWQQTGNFNLNVGLDKNNGYLAKKTGANKDIFYKIGDGNWVQNTDASIDGSPMMRMVVGEEIKPVVGVSEVKKEPIKVYPNPFIHQVSVETAGQFLYELHNINGQKLQEGHAFNSTVIDTHQLSKGIYLLQIIQDNGAISTRKIIKN